MQKTTTEELMLGAVMRVADATEAMAKNYVELQADCERHRQSVLWLRKRIIRLEHSLAATRGHLTRAKRKLKLNAKSAGTDASEKTP